MALLNLTVLLGRHGHKRLADELWAIVQSGEWREIQKEADQRLLLNAKWGAMKARALMRIHRKERSAKDQELMKTIKEIKRL
jgi:hypothetical protein